MTTTPEKSTRSKTARPRIARRSAGALALSLIAAASLGGRGNAAVTSFDINQTFAQGISENDIFAPPISLGSAGSFTVDPGSSPNYFDFEFTVGAFAANGVSPGGYPWMASFSEGDTITISLNFDRSAWTTILDEGNTAGVWDNSHSGYLGFQADGGELGYIAYDYTRVSGVSTMTLKSGAFESVPGQSITVVPEPSSLLALSVGCIGFLWRRRRN